MVGKMLKTHNTAKMEEILENRRLLGWKALVRICASYGITTDPNYRSKECIVLLLGDFMRARRYAAQYAAEHGLEGEENQGEEECDDHSTDGD